MEITYKNRKLEKICTIASETVKFHGKLMAEKIHQRIGEISAAETLEEMLKFNLWNPGSCQAL